MSEKHTPGPWRVRWDTDKNPGIMGGAPTSVSRCDMDGPMSNICHMVAQGDGEYDSEVTTANAELIASAPSLRKQLDEANALLREAREILQRVYASDSPAGCMFDTGELLKKLEARDGE